MSHPATERILQILSTQSANFRLVEHPPCRTSEESAKARAAAGGGAVCGAKAIVVKAKRKAGGSEFDVFVLPGSAKIISKLLLERLPDIKEFRFALPTELAAQTGGLEAGMVPPFGQSVFEGIERLFVDEALLENEFVGFNAADLTRSIVVNTQDYIAAAKPNEIFTFSAPKDATG